MGSSGDSVMAFSKFQGRQEMKCSGDEWMDIKKYGVANLVNVERMAAPLSALHDAARNAVTGACYC